MQKYCTNCGKPLPEEPASFCPNCGTAVYPKSKPESEFDKFVSNKEPFAAAILSLLCPGLGQVYNGEFNKGLLIQLLFYLSFFFGGLFIWLLIPIPLAVFIIGIFDAYNEADKMKKGKTELKKNPTFKEMVVFVLWPVILICILVGLIMIFAIVAILAALLFSIPAATHLF